jgi:hypothetical protein
MERSEIDTVTGELLDQLANDPVAEADAVHVARLRRDASLTPAERLAKVAAVCRQAELLRTARRLP